MRHTKEQLYKAAYEFCIHTGSDPYEANLVADHRRPICGVMTVTASA